MRTDRLADHVVALTIVILAGLLAQACVSQQDETSSTTGAPKVILIIGDGMDDQQITIARNYLVGSGGRLTLDELPFRGSAQVQTVDEDDPRQPVYVADSANTATTMATGELTSIGRIATTAGAGEDIDTIMELARAAGLGTGIVTTSSLTDATPAAFVAHVGQRFCQGPVDVAQGVERPARVIDCSPNSKASGGQGSIAEQIAESGVDILLGGGSQYFDQLVEGITATAVADAARANGYDVIRERDELANLGDESPVLGLFSPNTMPVRLRGAGGAEARRIEQVDGHVRLAEPFVCEPDPAFENTPTLAEMTRAALTHLDGIEGFMLMIESASIDKQSHVRRPCGHIGELGQLDETLAVALKYSEVHPETLVLVTADHSHAAQIVSETGEFIALNFASPGYFARVRTPEGGVMGINYATNDSPIREYHTGSQIPVFGSGPGVGELPRFMRQAAIFAVMARHLGLID